MRVALLSSGPSLLTRLDPAVLPGFDLRIGVNWAAARHEVDWWSVGDDEGVRMIPGLGRPHLYTLKVSADRLRAAGETRRLMTWCEAGRRVEPTPSVGWADYSAPAALVLAAALGAKAVEVWGVDLAGAEDCHNTGRAMPNRDERRWREEEAIWERMLAWLRGRGVDVVEHSSRKSR